MPRRSDLESILIIGAGPIVIGQACEFDYSGAQACKALKEEGYRVILVNSNPATIMTDPAMADATYIEPIRWQTVAKVIEKERPSALLPTMGGQTALNCALDLDREGVLAKFGVQLIGANADAIDKAEDRNRFDKAMKAIGLNPPKSHIAHTLDEARAAAADLGYPCIIRPSFTMGGSGGGVASTIEVPARDPVRPRKVGSATGRGGSAVSCSRASAASTIARSAVGQNGGSDRWRNPA